MAPICLTALPIASFALTVGLWIGFGDASAWRTTAVVLGAALISWALSRNRASYGLVECEGVERHAAGRRETVRAREQHQTGPAACAARLPRDVRCDPSGGLRGRRPAAQRRVRS